MAEQNSMQAVTSAAGAPGSANWPIWLPAAACRDSLDAVTGAPLWGVRSAEWAAF
ncbi:hypothetical protein OHA21_31420 [Actinoplanes sp. NBC_00393]|uniref:hypothetical protein n=1 Tax=Actinoplanes sp. NBC_00393 TaxID=2975953 RepID=UPI002E2243B2